MSTAFEERSRESKSRFNGAGPKTAAKPTRPRRIQNASSGSQLLTDLLDAVPIDLARISEHIRSHAEIAELITRLARSLLLSADSRITIEDAAVMLGTDRLRVVVYMWSLLPEIDGSAKSAANGERNPTLTDNRAGTRPQPTVETLYLSYFLRWLGLDSPNPATSGLNAPCFALGLDATEFAELRNMLLTDFFTLMPILDRNALHPRAT